MMFTYTATVRVDTSGGCNHYEVTVVTSRGMTHAANKAEAKIRKIHPDALGWRVVEICVLNKDRPRYILWNACKAIETGEKVTQHIGIHWG